MEICYHLPGIIECVDLFNPPDSTCLCLFFEGGKKKYSHKKPWVQQSSSLAANNINAPRLPLSWFRFRFVTFSFCADVSMLSVRLQDYEVSRSASCSQGVGPPIPWIHCPHPPHPLFTRCPLPPSIGPTWYYNKSLSLSTVLNSLLGWLHHHGLDRISSLRGLLW